MQRDNTLAGDEWRRDFYLNFFFEKKNIYIYIYPYIKESP